MRILVVGGGGREHTLAWKLAADSSAPELFCAPGNAGTAQVATNVGIGSEDIDALVEWAGANRPDLTVVGPEAPLCAGIADRFAEAGLRVFGPGREAARLEGSKAFAKEVMEAAGVPTAKGLVFQDAAQALEYVKTAPLPLVVKADGLAAGKGVSVCATAAEAERAIDEALVQRRFGEAGDSILVEECLAGEEASILALVDGEHVVMLASSQDHKRVFNNDEGPNTGGMGAYSPAPVVDSRMWPLLREEVFGRTLRELKARGLTYKGVLYAGIMVTPEGPKVLEFNCRFGDPETQAVLPRMTSDLVPALNACVDGNLTEEHVTWDDGACVCVVMASGGYPGAYEKGKPIKGLGEAAKVAGLTVFHAGTAREGDRIVTAGGRVLGVTAVDEKLEAAVRRAYRGILKIKFDQAQYRTDIGARALRQEARK